MFVLYMLLLVVAKFSSIPYIPFQIRIENRFLLWSNWSTPKFLPISNFASDSENCTLIATSASTPTSASSPTLASSQSSTPSVVISTYIAVAIGVVGVIALIVLVGVVCLCCVNHRRKKQIFKVRHVLHKCLSLSPPSISISHS